MPDRFAYLKPINANIKADVWDNGIIVLDTNVLLHVYRTNANFRQLLIDILQHDTISPRIWIPYQVAKEFYTGRERVISDQIGTFAYISKALDNYQKSVQDRLREDGPLIDRALFLITVSQMRLTLESEFNKNLEKWPCKDGEDLLLQEVEAILQGKIGPTPSDDQLTAWRKEGKQRHENNLPPSFLDKDKAKQGDPDEGLGDFFIWMQTLAYLSEHKSHAIFVTDDAKEDWWKKSGQKQHGPRPELRQEFQEKTGKEIEFCSSKKFLDWANNQRTERAEVSDVAELGESIQRAAASQDKQFAFDYSGKPDFSVSEMYSKIFEQMHEKLNTLKVHRQIDQLMKESLENLGQSKWEKLDTVLHNQTNNSSMTPSDLVKWFNERFVPSVDETISDAVQPYIVLKENFSMEAEAVVIRASQILEDVALYWKEKHTFG